MFDEYRNTNESKDVLLDLLNGPNSELYWESWDQYMNNTFLIDGIKYYVVSNEDLWLVPVYLDLPDDWLI